ncbi:AfsR/SARP family transcriptional regulator [Rhizohabitans arisaemae]|uniref:AfsR/SARP family transcriptional regulator n=1 Tax=Rhizohabitans arisaemae TaxID=2720610 RepID=UPI0024B0CE54|nr:BTAD domain-containing putative transcriptional regulator [Rhizohabitans arisaemae]
MAETVHELRLMGPFRLLRGGSALQLSYGVARLVAALAITGAMSRSQAAGLLWPDRTEQQALSNLRTTLSRLSRKTRDVVECDGDVLSLSEGTGVDVEMLTRWINDTIYGLGSSAGELTGPPADVDRPLLAGWSDDWVVDSRERLRMLTAQALQSAAARLLSLGRPAEALPYGLAAVQTEPWSESANRILLEIHARRGDPGSALRQYEKFSRILLRELGVPPAPDIVAAIQQLYPFGTGRVKAV